jgi:membrane protease YdiL (CAAX protease family)
VSGRRLLALLGLWAVLAGVSIGPTILALRLPLAAWTAAHGALAGAVLLVEAYATLLVALLLAFGGTAGLRDRLGFRFTSFGDLFVALGVWLLALITGGVVAALLTPITGMPPSNAVRILRLSSDPLFVGLVLPTICLLAPACEELLFRGAVFGWLRLRLPVLPAAALSAALFAGAHLLPALFPELFIFGLAAAWIYQRSGSTLNSFAMHASQNTLATIAAYAVLRTGG